MQDDQDQGSLIRLVAMAIMMVQTLANAMPCSSLQPKAGVTDSLEAEGGGL